MTSASGPSGVARLSELNFAKKCEDVGIKVVEWPMVFGGRCGEAINRASKCVAFEQAKCKFLFVLTKERQQGNASCDSISM